MLLPYPDLGRYSRIEGQQVDWFRSRGMSEKALKGPPSVMLAHGYKAPDGLFEESAAGEAWLAFPEAEDVVYWRRRTNEFCTWNGRAFAIGQDAIDDITTFTFDNCLNIFASPLDWLRAGRDGIVIVNWSQAFDRLRDVPSVAPEAALLQKYEKSMVPKRLPRVFVIQAARTAA